MIMNLDLMLIELKGNKAEDVMDALVLQEHKIAMHLAKGLIMAVSEGESEFKFAEVVFEDGQCIQLGCNKRDYYEAMHKQIDILERYEEYEMCAQLKESIKKLK